jgi:hypothetical protein
MSRRDNDWVEKVFGPRELIEAAAGPHPAMLDDDALLAQCEFGRQKSGGPGGQHRNKVETTVILTHNPTGIHAKAGERRSQVENKSVALFRLRVRLAVEFRTLPSPGDVRSDLWRSRVKDGKIALNPEHHDFPAMLAEALDVLAACGWEPRDAAIRLDATPSQLIKLLKDEPTAFVKVNEERAKRRLHALH